MVMYGSPDGLTIPIDILIEELESKGFQKQNLEGGGFSLQSSKKKGGAVLINSISNDLNGVMLRQILGGLSFEADEIEQIVQDLVQRAESASGDQEGSVIDIEAAIELLQTAPHEKYQIDPERKLWMAEFFRKLESEKSTDVGPTDASERLNKYIYGDPSENAG